MKTYNRNQLLKLKAKIKGLAAEGCHTHQILRTKKGPERDRYWQLKREIGKETRHYLIAYGFLRGKTFREMEPNADLSSARWNISSSRIVDIIKLEKGHYTGWTYEEVENHIFSRDTREAA